MSDQAAKDIRDRLVKASKQLGMCLTLPREVVDSEAADELLKEMRLLVLKAERVLRDHGKLLIWRGNLAAEEQKLLTCRHAEDGEKCPEGCDG